MSLDRDTVLAALRAEDVAAHLGITGAWRGRWLRSRRCGATDHTSDAFGLSREGYWHCWACDQGGDLLALVAAGERLDVRRDFPAVLAAAALIAGVDDSEEWGGATRPAPRPRPELPPLPPVGDRIALARRRAAWVWDRLLAPEELPRSVADLYLAQRGLDPGVVRRREAIRETPLRCTPQERAKSDELRSLASSFSWPALAVPVRAIDDGALVDVRVRRFEPRPDQPKIVGMLGSITTAAAAAGHNRQLVGCYGHPEDVDADLVVVVEGALDYLSALVAWPEAQVLGAVEAGSLALVTAHAARRLAARDQTSRLIVVEQDDPPRTLRDGRQVPGAADASCNEDPNAATKVMVRILGPARVGWIFCGLSANLVAGQVGMACKDLNDLVRAGADVHGLVRWWSETGEA